MLWMIWKQEGSCEQPTMFHTADSPQKFLGHGKAVELVCFLGGFFFGFFCLFFFGGGQDLWLIVLIYNNGVWLL